MKPTTLITVLAPLSLVAVAAAFHVTRDAEAKAAVRGFWDHDLVEFVRGRVASAYVDEVSEPESKELFYGALDGYLRSLPDPYNDFIPPEEYKRWIEETAGQYAGVGVKVTSDPDGLRIAGVLPGGPASLAGIRVGDLVTEVDGRTMAPFDLATSRHVQLLKGPPGSVVKAMVVSPSSDPGAAPGTAGLAREVAITRAMIRPPTVFARRIGPGGQVGYLRLKEFDETTGPDFDRELDAMIAGGVTSLVVDLRGNSGGVLPTTVHIADRFIASGEIVRLQGRDATARRVDVAREAGTIPAAIGLVVLVDGASASASEVFAGCMQDHRRGVLLGTRTYGKFLVQNIVEVPSRGAALKITTARYQTPNGRSYQRTASTPRDQGMGLIPDVVVELSHEDAARLAQTWLAQEELLWGAGASDGAEEAWIDPQLQRALDLIAGDLLLQEIRGSGVPRNG